MLKKLALVLLLLPVMQTNADVEPERSQSPDSNTEGRLPLRELRTFTQVFEQVRLGYVEEVTDTELLENAIEGLLTGLDPHSTYLKKEDYGDLQRDEGLPLQAAF